MDFEYLFKSIIHKLIIKTLVISYFNLYNDFI